MSQSKTWFLLQSSMMRSNHLRLVLMQKTLPPKTASLLKSFALSLLQRASSIHRGWSRAASSSALPRFSPTKRLSHPRFRPSGIAT
jgi:hypothetical protein